MKILYITNTDDKYGGAQCLMELMERMSAHEDIEMVFLNPIHNKFNEWCDERKIENHSFRYFGQMYSKHDEGIKYLIKYYSYFFRYHIINPITLKKIEKVIDIKSFNVIHTNTATQDVGMLLAKKYGIKHIWHLREFGKEDMNFIPFRKDCYERMNREGGSFLAISDVIKEAWVKKGIESDKITRIYDGVRAEAFTGKAHLFEDDKIRICLCGSITAFKDQEQLIDAFGMMPEEYRKKFIVDFWGAGKETYVNKLKEKISGYGLDEIIHFRGYSNDMYQELYNYDIGVTCSNSEAFGRVTVEYMMAGLITLASNTGANVELIRDGETSLLYEKTETGDLTEKLIWISEHIEECRRIAESGCEYAKKAYSIEENAESFYEFYKKL